MTPDTTTVEAYRDPDVLLGIIRAFVSSDTWHSSPRGPSIASDAYECDFCQARGYSPHSIAHHDRCLIGRALALLQAADENLDKATTLDYRSIPLSSVGTWHAHEGADRLYYFSVQRQEWVRLKGISTGDGGWSMHSDREDEASFFVHKVYLAECQFKWGR